MLIPPRVFALKGLFLAEEQFSSQFFLEIPTYPIISQS